MVVFLNGEVVDEKEAKVSVFDRGFLYGDGVFETMRAYDGLVFDYRAHYERLAQSARLIELSLPLAESDILEICQSLLESNGLKDAYVRVAISRGEAEGFGYRIAGAEKPTVVVVTRPITPYPEGLYRDGAKAVILERRKVSSDAVSPLIKSASGLPNILARIEASRWDAIEGIMLSSQGYVAEGSSSNVFWVSKGTLFTPSLKAGILDGITRRHVIRIGWKVLGLKVEEGLYSPDDLFRADEVFLTNTIVEVLPVTRIDGRRVGDGVVGPVTKEVLHEYRKLTRRSSGS